MNKENYPKTLLVNEKLSNTILLFLLLLRMVDQYLPGWIFGARIPYWYAYWYVGVAYILTVAIVWLNRHRLASLNIDRPFLAALMIGGCLYMFYLTPDIGILVALTTVFVYWAYRTDRFPIPNAIRYPSETILLIPISIVLALLPVALFNLTIEKHLNVQTFLASAYQAQLAGTIFEEVIFRGALWGYLRRFELKERTIFLIQAFIFWIAHSKYMFSGNAYSFWAALPLASLLFGFLAWRSKSLTPGTFAHFLLNLTSELIRKLM